ncbi:MAG: CHASE2 domain-containing protein [Phycisphaerales bacterium]|nr:CHASE2 domain-containing protein [Phycisphaerales bacterium]
MGANSRSQDTTSKITCTERGRDTLRGSVIRRSNPKVLLSALLATLAVVLIDIAGGFVGWNEQLLDLEQQHLPRDVGPMSDDIVMVDIDDAALERLARWPWPRSKIAGAIEELHRAGARTIAIDLDLADPQESDSIDHDAELARAISDRVILGTLLIPDELELRWNGAGGTNEQLEQVLSAIQQDLSQDPRLSAPESAELIQETLHLLRRRAIFESSATETAESLRKSAGDHHVALGPAIDAAVRQRASRDGLMGTLPGGPDRPPSASDRFPLEKFAAASGGTGYVNIVRRSVDGGIRHMVPSQPVGYSKVIAPLGIAAVHRFLGEDTPLVIENDELRIGDVVIPLTDNAMTVCWPRGIAGLDWPNLHRKNSDDNRFTGHVSIGEVVAMSEARDFLQLQEQEVDKASRLVLAVVRGTDALDIDDWNSPEIQAEIREEVSWSLENITTRADIDAADISEDDRNGFRRMFDWKVATNNLAAAKSRLASSEEQLRKAVDDRLVFIGWTATGTLADFVPTAAGPRTPGVMVHAAIADMVLQNRVLQEGPAWWSPVAAALCGVIVALLASIFSPLPATISAVAVLTVWAGMLVLLFGQFGLVLPAASPLVAITLAWASGTSSRAILVQQEKGRITRQFRARVPAALIDELARDPDALSMRGVRREVCVMFGDLAGFTTLSEQLDTEATVALLNRCMAGLTERVTDRHAYLNKFLGDGFLAFWSAFGEQPDQATLACHAAIECQAFMEEINAASSDGLPKLGLRIGIATGEAVVGDCGAPPKLNDYTVIGDVANLAARLESANKQFGTPILMDGRTRSLVTSGELPLIEVGPIQVVGRDGVIDAWTLATGPTDCALATQASSFATAIRSGDRVAAQQALKGMKQHGANSTLTQKLSELVSQSSDPMPHALRLSEK